MGACDFSVIATGKTAQDAFESAVNDAAYEYGHDAYSGTIATKDGFTMVELPRYGTKKYREAYERELDYSSKWDDALCYEITGSVAKSIKERSGLKGTHKKVFLFFGWAPC